MTEQQPTQNVGVSNLSDGFQQTPLREFKGLLESYEPELDQQNQKVRIGLNFSDVSVIQSTEPYPFPIAILSLPASTRKRSMLGYLMVSADKLVPGITITITPGVDKVPFLVGKKLHMKMIEENMGRWRGEEKDRIVGCWEVMGIEGMVAGGTTVAAESAHDLLIRLANGKPAADLKAFYQEAFKSPMLKKPENKGILAKILNKTFIPEAIEAGELVELDGILIAPALAEKE